MGLRLRGRNQDPPAAIARRRRNGLLATFGLVLAWTQLLKGLTLYGRPLFALRFEYAHVDFVMLGVLLCLTLLWLFRHELTRDAAYATILNRRRREFHLKVAQAVEELFEGRLEEQAHRLARHFELAGDDKSAARYFEMAGDVAVSLDGRTEAAGHFDRALEAARRGDDAAAVGRVEAKRQSVAA